MNVDAFLEALRADSGYDGQIVHVHEEPAREARYAEGPPPVAEPLRAMLRALGIERLYAHQDRAVRLALEGRDVLVATGTASGKSLCYQLPILEALAAEPEARALLLFPTKALAQDQFGHFRAALEAAGLGGRMAGVFDGDTPADLRRRLRDRGAVVFSNPDMLHAGLLPQHARWADFLAHLRFLVLDEAHVYSGLFGSNVAPLLTRFARVCAHYGAHPQFLASSATLANPAELAMRLTGRPFEVVDEDASPRGRRLFVLWNPPRLRTGDWHSRRSANVEAHELMARLIAQGAPTITFSKARLTAEMIHRYVTESLARTAPELAARVTPYRGGYLPAERREIERRLFRGELVGVSATSALELGIDVGELEASVIVGYPGTLASFFQQAGRAGRKRSDSVVFLVGLDTSINQYIMTHPEYLFDRCIEAAVIEPENPYVATGHLRCATHELPLPDAEAPRFGPDAGLALELLRENHKVQHRDGHWYHASAEVPQHEVGLRNSSGANVAIQDADTGSVIGEVDRYDAQPIVHPGAIVLQRGESYRVESLDLERNLALVRRVDVNYYTNPLGGTDVHHIDRRLRAKPFGPGEAAWGEVTAHFVTWGYQKIHFYSLDVLSVHRVKLPTLVLETMAVWIVPPEALLDEVRAAGLDVHSGLRGIGYATRMLLPLYLTCDTLDFSHSIGSANSPWQAIFIYERYPHGLGFTEKAFERLHEILPAVRARIRECPCEAGCPCCVGKPLRQYASWNVELWEASIPSKAAALAILDGLLADPERLNLPESGALSGETEAEQTRTEQALRRRLERMREPQVFHPIAPAAALETGYPAAEAPAPGDASDVARRAQRRRNFDRDLHKRLAKKLDPGGLPPNAPRAPVPAGMKTRAGSLRPTAFPGRPAPEPDESPREGTPPPASPPGTIALGDSLAARARRKGKKKG